MDPAHRKALHGPAGVAQHHINQGSLLVFEVQGVSAGSSALRISSVAVSTIDGVLLPVDVQHGELVVREAGAPSSTPGAPASPTAQAGETPTPGEAPAGSALPEWLWTIALVALVGLPLSLLIRWASRRKRRA